MKTGAVFDLQPLELSEECVEGRTSKLPSRALLMEAEGQLERVERPLSVCLPLRSCRLDATTSTQHTTTLVVSGPDYTNLVLTNMSHGCECV